MKRIALMFVLLVAALQLSAREVININRNWRFFSNTEGSSDGAQTVNLPHTWNNDALSGKKDYFRGVGNYIKDITIPLEWRNKRVFIRFNGAASVANLIVNGKHVGEHRGGYTAFTYELTKYLKYGEPNSIWVIVNNAPQMDVLPTAGDMNIYGGLFRDVELIVTEPSLISVSDYASDGIYIAQRKVSQDRAELDATVKVDGLSDRNLTVNLAVVNPLKDTVVFQTSKLKVPASGNGSVTLPIEMEDPVLWHGTANPYMYNVIVKLMDGEIMCDSVAVPLGLRFFSVDPKLGFMLNGEPYRLHGVVYYEDRATRGTAISSYQVEEDLKLMTEMGVNAIRAAGFPHNKEFYEECDRKGIIVWSDLPLIGPAYMTDKGYVDMDGFRNNGRQQLMEMIYQRYNNPSVLMWGLFSDLATQGDDPVAYVEELNAIAQREDPSRLTVAASNQDGKINFVTDMIVWDHTLGWKSGLPADISLWMEQLQQNWGSLCSGISYGAGASIYHQEDSLYRPVYQSNWHPERWQTHLHEQYFPYVNDAPYLWGWFVANMFDYGAAGRTWGEGRGLDDRGMVTFDRKYCKDAFYFYKANWNTMDPFVYIAEKRWNLRRSKTQNLKVYSNAEQVELLVNGVSLGQKVGHNGTFIWENVPLNEGVNAIEARSQAGTDETRITVASNKPSVGIF